MIANRHGVGRLRHTTSRITLSPGPLALFDADGSAVIVHLNPDRGINGATGTSGGPRVACGVIHGNRLGLVTGTWAIRPPSILNAASAPYSSVRIT